MWVGLIFCGSHSWSHNCCEFPRTPALLYLANTVSQLSPTNFGPYTLSDLVPDLYGVGDVAAVPFRAELSIVSYSLHAGSQLWATIFVVIHLKPRYKNKYFNTVPIYKNNKGISP